VQRDLILVGGGLANTLIAYRLRLEHPGLNLLLLERERTLGGNHTWCFHEMDLTPEQYRWIEPFVAHSWDRYRIMFPKRDRWLESGYHAITSDQLHAVATERLGDCVITGVDVESVATEQVTLADGRVFRGRAVIDGRGDPGGRHLDVRFQKFLGQVLQLEAPHGLGGPILMDATVPQEDGFRFIYTLPFDERTVLVEDTRYSDTAGLRRDQMREAIAAYAEARGWSIAAMTREEEGALPVVLGGSLRAYWKSGPGIPRSGIRAALFHFTTGYSFPEAVRLADDLAGLTPGWTSKALYNRIRRRSFSVWRRGLYFRLLNRMLYNGCEPSNRYRVLQHFYRLPKDLVGRFYAGRPTWHDRFRILTGTPPIPISRALISLVGGDRHTLAGLTGGKS
jgi:lycopene beta-cyclase